LGGHLRGSLCGLVAVAIERDAILSSPELEEAARAQPMLLVRRTSWLDESRGFEPHTIKTGREMVGGEIHIFFHIYCSLAAGFRGTGLGQSPSAAALRVPWSILTQTLAQPSLSISLGYCSCAPRDGPLSSVGCD
jgi:hypothetical protein